MFNIALIGSAVGNYVIGKFVRNVFCFVVRNVFFFSVRCRGVDASI